MNFSPDVVLTIGFLMRKDGMIRDCSEQEAASFRQQAEWSDARELKASSIRKSDSGSHSPFGYKNGFGGYLKDNEFRSDEGFISSLKQEVRSNLFAGLCFD